jgi:phosphopantothenoylcysteine synthetase/decarboxylase
LVGFALETTRVRRFAEVKLRKKNLDLIIGNGPESFSSHHIQPWWIERNGAAKKLPLMSKRALAVKIGRWLEKKYSSFPRRRESSHL